MAAHDWADEAILGRSIGPPGLLRRLLRRLMHLCSSGIRLCLIMAGTTAVVVLGIALMPTEQLTQAEQLRQDVHKDANRMMKRNIIPAGKDAVHEIKRISETYILPAADTDPPDAKSQRM